MVPLAASDPLRVEAESGLLRDVRLVHSPNQDDRPVGMAIDLLVIHSISLPNGKFGGPWIEALFRNTLDIDAHPEFRALEGLYVSAHLLIDRTGAITQYVPFHRRAWHAGESEFRGRCRCNDFSIGIELEGTDKSPFEIRQYERLAEVTRTLMDIYPGITPDSIQGHSDIAPHRKRDPGSGFDWPRYRQLIDNPTSTGTR